jgi:DedD protein
MAFFKFRKAADEPASAPPQPQSIEAIRQRAKYRLVGASVLVLIGVIGFPLLFDKQPRPIAVDTPIDIPDRNKLAPITLPNAPAAMPVPSAAVTSVTAQAPTEASVVASDKSAPVSTAANEPGVITETSDKNMPLAHVNKAEVATQNIVTDAPKLAKPAASAPVSKATESANVQALLDAKGTEEPAAGASRFVVQVGAFADAARAREVRLKVEQAGLKTYTHVAETKDGKRIRVRVGPFATKPEAEKAAEKIKKLNLPAALLTL